MECHTTAAAELLERNGVTAFADRLLVRGRVPQFAVEHRRGDPPDALRIGDRVYLDDAAVDYREAHDGDRPAADGDDRSGRPVHERGRH